MTSSTPLQFDDVTHVVVRGRRLLYFAGCDYLRFSGHPVVRKAMFAAMKHRPFGTSASRTTTGEHGIYREAERGIARFMGQPAAVMTGAGYLAPIAACQAIKAFATYILLDEVAHASMANGAVLSGLPVQRFAHADVKALRQLLRRLPRNARPVIACDGLQGARGRFTPLAAYFAELPKRGWLLVDDAHGFGTAGPGGRGSVAAQGLHDGRIIQTISLSKSLGLQGGAVIGQRSIVDAVYHTAAAFIGNTAPMLPIASGVVAAVKLLARSGARVEHLQSHAQALRRMLPVADHIWHEEGSPVLVILPQSDASARQLRSMLQRCGIFPSWITYLNSPQHGIFRFALCSEHRPRDVEQLGEVICRWHGQRA